LPAGWLYTNGNKIYLSDGNGGGTVWVGRGVNVDDLYFCGFNYTLWISDAESQFTTLLEGAVSSWKATFLRVSLSMNCYPADSSWLSNAAQYQTPMTNAINAAGADGARLVAEAEDDELRLPEAVDQAAVLRGYGWSSFQEAQCAFHEARIIVHTRPWCARRRRERWGRRNECSINPISGGARWVVFDGC
jgi:hypothetical protein